MPDTADFAIGSRDYDGLIDRVRRGDRFRLTENGCALAHVEPDAVYIIGLRRGAQRPQPRALHRDLDEVRADVLRDEDG
jgi:hypothetical protein